MSEKLQGAVVVITGASSGIGRAAALEFARKRAIVVLAARRETDGNLFKPMQEGTEISGGWKTPVTALPA